MIKKGVVLVALVVLASLLIAGCTTTTTPTPTPTPAATSESTQSTTKTATTTSTHTPAPKQQKQSQASPTSNPSSDAGPFIGNKATKVYHYPWCSDAAKIKPENRVTFPTAAAAKAAGYRPCKHCNPP
ncbi:MAG: Ada metal-binding domain-containing protein [Halobacteriota archaeon]